MPDTSPQASKPPDLQRLPERWRRAPRRWGHPVHSLCSYFAMFPPQLPNVFIRWLTEPGDVVYDPFAGRGTVALETVLQGRVAYASDANPLAVALSRAKVEVPGSQTLIRRLEQLERDFKAPNVSAVPPEIQMLYSPMTLEQIVFLRETLNPARSVDRFLIATTLGLLHANHSARGATRGLSISMPNTFAMAPGYVSRYIEEHNLCAPRVDVFSMLRRRLRLLALPTSRVCGGRAWQQDASAGPPTWLKREKVRLVFTSPPYLQVIKYGKYNWVRLWFLGEEPKAVDQVLTDTASVGRYRRFMGDMLTGLASVIRDDGYVCLVIGDVRRSDDESINLAHDVWEEVAAPAGWHLHGIVTDRLPSARKVSRIWKDTPGRATKIDRILILSRGDGAGDLPPLGRIRWTEAGSWPASMAGGT